MGLLSACARGTAIVVVAGFCALSARAADPLPMLLASPPAQDAGAFVATAAAATSAVTRQRRVVVDFGYLDPRSAPATPILGVELFDGQVVTLERGRIEARAPGNYTWYGKVRGYAHGDVVLTVVAGHIAGSIVIVDAGVRASTTFELLSVVGGTQWLRQLDLAGFPPDHPSGVDGLVVPSPPGGPVGATPGLLQPNTDVVAADTGALIDVMVVYSNQTAAAAGAGISAQIQQAVDRANLAYANSGIAPRLRLVHHAQVSYAESGNFNTDLDRLTSIGDGYMDEAHAWRDTYGADLVSLFIENGAYCGLGWLNSSAAYGFTAVNRGCAGPNLSFAHELGHNVGARHDPYVDASTSPYAYAHGYAYAAGLWRTVMAYNNACADAGVSCTRVPYFSNPDVSYGSPATAMGTIATHDNARVHDERANTVANFRQAVIVAAPTATSGAATAIAATGATLNGIVSSNGAGTTVNFEYGPSTSYGSSAVAAQSPLAAGAANAPVSAAIAGLVCNTLYHFRVRAVNSAGPTNGADLAFTTAACPASAPTATTAAATAATATGATLNGTVSSNGADTTVTFQYGVTTSYGSSIVAAQSPLAAGATGSAVTAAIGGLACNTLYHFRVVGANTAGTTNGADLTFTTAACPSLPAPTATTTVATAVTATGAALNGVVSSNGSGTTVTFQFGLTTSYTGIVTAAQSPLAPGAASASVSAAIGGLACNALHHFRVVGANGGGTANGADLTFTTAPCSGATTATTLASNANPSAAGTAITLTASVTGPAPTGSVAFSAGGNPIVGCGSVPVSGSGGTRKATCTTNVLAVGAHSLAASYGGDVVHAASASPALVQQVVSALPITGIVVADPYGGMSVQGGTLVGNTITITSPAASIQLGSGAAAPASYAQIDFAALHIGAGNTLTIRSGAPGQVVVLRNVSAAASAIGGTLQAQGGNGAASPELHVWNPNGIAIAPSGNVLSPSGLSLDALDASWTAGQNVEHAGVADGGAYLALSAANIRGGGAFKGNAIGLHTLGSANNPVNGAYFLQNGLQLYPSTGNAIALTLNGFGPAKQVFNVFANGNATAWMPSAWPAGVNLPPNNAVVMPGGARAPGAPEPAYGGGSMILQASGSLTLTGGGSNDFVFPGAIVLKAVNDLDVNGVLVNQGWTTSGQAFQGIFFEAPSIVSPNGLIQVYGNDLNWMNFSTLPQQYVRAFTLKRNPDGSASYVATDTTTPHQNTYSLIQNTAASGGCWLCQISTQPVNMYGP